jgi:hypothetical protein
MPGINYRAQSFRDLLLQGSPTVPLVENFPRDQIATDLVASLSSGVMTSVAIILQQGDVVTSLSFLSGATALVTPTNEWAALYDTGGNLLAQSTTGTPAWAADTFQTFTLATAQTIVTTGVYFASLMVQATTVPTLMGKTLSRAAASGALVAGMKSLARTSGSALTTTAPATIASPTNVATIPYVVVQ